MLPVELLRQDVDIIDDQEEHLVFSVRVSKATILRNHGLLMAISGAVCGQSTPPASAPVSNKPKMTHWIYAALICAAFVAPSPASVHHSVACEIGAVALRGGAE